MFKNIGKKIMGLAKFCTGVGIAVSALGAIACAVAILVQDDELVVPAILAAAAVFGVGFLVSWISSFLLYGFGQLIHNSEECKLLLKQINEKPAAAPAVPPVTPVTPVTPAGGNGDDDGGFGGDDNGTGGGNDGGNGGNGDGGDDEGFGSFGGEGFDELVGKIKF